MPNICVNLNITRTNTEHNYSCNITLIQYKNLSQKYYLTLHFHDSLFKYNYLSQAY